jgi:hypothetical protein
VPTLADLIPWNAVFARIGELYDVLINPEIQHSRIAAPRAFCAERWGRRSLRRSEQPAEHAPIGEPDE